jgi:hypothetical protein
MKLGDKIKLHYEKEGMFKDSKHEIVDGKFTISEAKLTKSSDTLTKPLALLIVLNGRGHPATPNNINHRKDLNTMKQYKLIYTDGKTIIVNGGSALEVVRKYDLASRANAGTRIIQLEDK